uniref:Uncharacterized protein n=1 Tax=Aegilops tauschii TaxID=37682 RepID=M8BNW7_AEGTA
MAMNMGNKSDQATFNLWHKKNKITLLELIMKRLFAESQSEGSRQRLPTVPEPSTSDELAVWHFLPCKDGSMFMCPRLYTAAFEGQTEEVTGLLMGSSVDAPAAARNGRPSTAVNHRGPCTAQEVTAERNTLLHIAAGQGHGGLIAELCYRDSSLLSSVNKALDTPLHSAARAGGANAVEDIVRLARANCLEEGGALDTPLHSAARAGGANAVEDIVRLARANCLEEGGVIIRGKNVAGDTALHLAARHGHGAAVEKLVKLAPELASELNRAGVSSLYLAVTSGSVDAVRAIVSHGDASAAGPNQQNALHAAVLESSGFLILLHHCFTFIVCCDDLE